MHAHECPFAIPVCHKLEVTVQMLLSLRSHFLSMAGVLNRNAKRMQVWFLEHCTGQAITSPTFTGSAGNLYGMHVDSLRHKCLVLPTIVSIIVFFKVDRFLNLEVFLD